MNDYQIRFLKQSVLGQQVIINNPNNVINRCIELADKDMMAGGRFVCKFFKKPEKQDRVRYIYEMLKECEYDYTIINKKTVCNEIFWTCDDSKILTINGKERFFRPFGLAQKLINMTFKYLYVYKEHIGIYIDFSKCECPVDSVILEKLNLPNKWTNITLNDYDSIKKAIETALEDIKYSEMKAEIGALAFDDNWVNDEV